MSNSFWGVTDNFLPGTSRSQNFLKKDEGGYFVSRVRLSDSDFEGKLLIANFEF